MPRRVAITGAAGQLGRQLVYAFSLAGDEVLALARPDFDITRPADLDRLVTWHPDVVVNSAAWTDVDGCAREPARAMRINGTAAGEVAASAARAGADVVQISTNEVFDGLLDRPYREDDATNPLNPYGASKLAGERMVAEADPRHLIVRTAWLYGPGGSNFPVKIRAAAERMRAEGRPLGVVADEWGNPTSTPWLADAIVRLVDPTAARSQPGVIHLAGLPPTTRFDWARAILRDAIELRPVALAEFPRDSTVPPRACLDVARAEALGINAADWRQTPAFPESG